MGTREDVSPATWLQGGGSWGVFLRAPASCFLGGHGLLAQGHRRWDLILTDLPAFPHSSQLRLQSLGREEPETQPVISAWTLLKDRPGIFHLHRTSGKAPPLLAKPPAVLPTALSPLIPALLSDQAQPTFRPRSQRLALAASPASLALATASR